MFLIDQQFLVTALQRLCPGIETLVFMTGGKFHIACDSYGPHQTIECFVTRSAAHRGGPWWKSRSNKVWQAPSVLGPESCRGQVHRAVSGQD